MSITYTWEVTGLKNRADGTVVQTYWKKTGTDADGNVGVFEGATPFERDEDDSNFVPFADLTEATVLGWIHAVVVEDYEEHVNEQIRLAIDGLSVSNVEMPWATSGE